MVSEADGAASGAVPGLRVWIDATSPQSLLELFGMPLLERMLRALIDAGIEPSEVRVEHAAGVDLETALPHELRARLPLVFAKAEGAPAAGLAAAARAGEVVIALEADAVVDPRLLAHIAVVPGSVAAVGGEGSERTAVVRLTAPPPPSDGANLPALAEAWIGAGAVAALPLAAVPAYVKKLRRELPAYCFRIPDAQARDRAETFLFWSNYKGSTDFFTKYVYPPLVWRCVRPLARWRVHPNWISGFNVVITLLAVPLFAAGQWVSGLTLAYTMSVLDSVDGKLARLTYRASRLGHVLDHGLDVVHPPMWYLAWAWALGGGDAGSPVFQAALWMTGFYVLDRLVTEAFTRATGKSIHAYAEIDVRMRTFISRRNINVPIFTLGLIVGAPVAAFMVIVAWQAATLAFHTLRLLQVWIPARGEPA